MQETAARKARDLQRVLELSRDLICIAGFDGGLLAVNPAWVSVLGYDEATLLSRPYISLIHPQDRERVEAMLGTLRGGAVVERFDHRLLCRDGGFRWFTWSIVPEGDVFYAVGRDTTMERLHLDEIAAANRQLLAQIEERERVEATLRQMQRLEAVGQLTSGVAHDFNNLLTVVLGNIEVMERSEPVRADPLAARRLETMRAAATRGANLTAQLLAFSRRQKLEARPVDLNQSVRGMEDLLRTTLGSGIALVQRLGTAVPPALVDATQLELVVLNLVINARDAMPAGGTLVIETATARLGPPVRPEEPPAADYVMVAVTDTGTGMPDAVRARMFEPFFTTKEVGKGSGLGLAQVFGFAQQSGGGLVVETTEGAGTTVRVFLPPASGPVGGGNLDAAPSGGVSAGRPPARVLVVDDNAAIRDVAAVMLEDHGFEVLVAGSGGAALDLLEREPGVALLLLDYAMPGMTGLEVARVVAERRPGLPVLFMTGYADPAALAEIAAARIVRKPFQETDLLAQIRATLRPAPATAESA